MYEKFNQRFIDSYGYIYDHVVIGNGKGSAAIIAADPIPMFDVGSVLNDLSCIPKVDSSQVDTQYTCSYQWENQQLRMIGFFYQGIPPSKTANNSSIKCEVIPLKQDSKGNVQLANICYHIKEGMFQEYSGTFLIGTGFRMRYYPRYDTMQSAPCDPKCFKKLYEVTFVDGREVSRVRIRWWNLKKKWGN